MLIRFINALWKGQNAVGKLLLILVAVFGVTIFYYRVTFGIYKHKYINELEKRETEFKQRLNDIETQKQINRKKVLKRTTKLKKDVSKIEEKRIEHNKVIDGTIISDYELEQFLSKYQQNKEL